MRFELVFIEILSIFVADCGDEDMELDIATANSNKLVKSGIERMLEFGRELFQMSQRLEKENGIDGRNSKMLEVTR